MQKHQFTDEQIVAILQQAETRRAMRLSPRSTVRELERENARLKRLLAERDLGVDIIKELLQKK